MDYDEFFAQYKSAHDLWAFGRLDLEAATAEVRRLRALVPSIEPADERRTAEYLLDQWVNETSPQAEDRVARATAALNRATADVTAGAGTTAERRARAEAGIVEISGIADETADVAERYAILALNESLAKLIDTLERGESQGRR